MDELALLKRRVERLEAHASGTGFRVLTDEALWAEMPKAPPEQALWYPTRIWNNQEDR